MSEGLTAPGPKLACGGCGQTLFGPVRFCPFCGAAQEGAGPKTALGGSAKGGPGQSAEVPRHDGSEEPGKTTTGQVDGPLPDATAREAEVIADAVKSEAKPETAASRAGPEDVRPPAPKKASSVATPVPPPVAAIQQPAKAQPEARRGGMAKWLVPVVLLVGAAWGWQALMSPKGPDACQQALQGAGASMEGRQFAEAKSIALGAIATCEPELQERARTLLRAAEQALAADQKCDQALQLARSQIAGGTLKLAERTLAPLPGSCSGAVALKAQVESNRASAAGKLAEAVKLSGSAQFEDARALVTEAEGLDRDNGDLARTRARIAVAEREAIRAAEQAAIPEPPTVRAPPPQAPAVTSPLPSPDSRRVECSILVRSGERALAGNSYDIAMQNAREAQSAVADCPGARELFERARDAKDRARQGVVIN